MSVEETPCMQDIFERDLIREEFKRTLQFASTDENQFRSRTTDLAAYQRKFNKLQTKIEKTLIKSGLFNKEENIKIRNDFNDLYYAIVSHVNKLKDIDQRRRRLSRSLTHLDTADSNKRNLPTLPLPQFHGDPMEWTSFYDLFRSLVHSNNAYTEVEKFRYLLLSVKNEPYNIIKSIPITEDNYIIALETLQNRYESKRIIAQKHLDCIFDVQNCNERSTVSLRNLLNTYQENIKALETMYFPVDQWSFILLNILLRKLPINIRKGFERSLPNSFEIPDVKSLISYLEREITADEIASNTYSNHSVLKFNAREPYSRQHVSQDRKTYSASVSVNTAKNSRTSVDSNKVHFNSRPSASFTSRARDGIDVARPAMNQQPNNNKHKVRVCSLCDGNHLLSKCLQFLNLSPQNRYNFVRNKNICCNCLNIGHDVKACSSNYSCHTCQRKHHSLLHLSSQAQSNNVVNDTVPSRAIDSYVPRQASEERKDGGSVHNNNCVAKSSPPPAQPGIVLLATALININIGTHNRTTVRCVVDTGSQASFITDSCVQRLGLVSKQVNVPVYGIGDTEPVRPRGLVSCLITPNGKQEPIIPVDALILPNLMSKMPNQTLPFTDWPHIKNLALADPVFHSPLPVEMLLGADILSHILLGNTIIGPPDTPMAMNSVFGYLLLGKVNLNSINSTPLNVCFSSFDNDNLQRFWELESITTEERGLTPDEELCESFFQKTHSRDSTGRYVVALPFKSDAPPLGESRQIALSRFSKLEYRLERNSQLKANYHECLQEYVDLNHMELVEGNTPAGTSYYIPHHCVIRPTSETTRTRVVFDAGCRSTSGYCLNDTLLPGPKLHPDIVDILLKFRVHFVAFTADIKHMYRSILVRKQDRDFQRILWRKSPDEPLRDYRLRTVTFGVNASPYLALRTIKQLASDEADRFPLASAALLEEVFVDDIVSGAETENAALALQQELIGICQAAGFDLRKWHSNSQTILEAVLSTTSQGGRLGNVTFSKIENNIQTKVLGLQWNPKTDSFSFLVTPSNVAMNQCTKRIILSEVAKVYDPLGFLSPVTLFAKHLIQLLWVAKVGWDDPPPANIVNAWKSFTKELPILRQISFPRHVFNTDNLESIQIHGFADASQIAYAACVYIRLTDKDKIIHTYLLIAKTRVAPLRVRLTIPRLELMGCLLLSKLIEKILFIYKNRVRLDQVYAWTDATIVLAWLRSPSRDWKTFVSNRTNEILSRVPATCWHHVPSADNPADAASRGLLPGALLNHTLWYSGPLWLQSHRSSWPTQAPTIATDEEKRSFPTSCNVLTKDDFIPNLDFISRFSTLGKLVRVVARIFRLFNRIKSKCSYPKYITVHEYKFSLTRLILLVQKYSFQDDRNAISEGNLVSNRLKRLTPFLDSDGFLRVGGRLHKSLLPFESKHQLILPKKHHLVNLIIDTEHVTLLHAGPQTTRYSLLQRYWIISSRDIVRQRIHACVLCFRARPVRCQPRMGQLPEVRTQILRPFLKTSVDFAGHFFVRANKVRNAKIVKCYVAVFVCMSVKAIHLEIVSELSTEAFLAALRRFTSRRGLCTDIYSDCGKNFVGCNNYLKDLYNFLRNDSVQSVLHDETLKQGITWHFQPPYASHFGGLFEAGVKSFKHHLHRVVGTRTQTYDEMHTLLCQIEAILNSRPLCLISSDATDPLPLTPSHFLIGAPLTALPDISLLKESPNRLTRWRWVQQSLQHFWQRWSREYLHEIQQSHKWFHDRGAALCEGTVVVVCDDHAPPLQWKLARVHTLHPGADGVVRVVTLRMGNTLVKRPVRKVCPLPVE